MPVLYHMCLPNANIDCAEDGFSVQWKTTARNFIGYCSFTLKPLEVPSLPKSMGYNMYPWAIK